MERRQLKSLNLLILSSPLDGWGVTSVVTAAALRENRKIAVNNEKNNVNGLVVEEAIQLANG